MKHALKVRLALGVVAAAAVLAAALGWLQPAEGDGAKYVVAKVERGAIAAVVAASGTLNAVATVQVAAQIPGQVKEIYADFKTPVKRGQVLARMDAAAYELRVAHARADLEGARERLAALQGQQPKASRAELRRALTAVKERESLLAQAQADLERTAILAPVDGIVILRNVDAGQTVAAAEPQAPVLFTLAEDLRHMQIEAAMDAADARRLRVGLEAAFSVDAFPRRVFAGEVLQVRKSPRAGPAAPSYTAVISAPNPDLALLPGMAADVRIVLHRRESVLKVPNAALRFRMPGDKPNRSGATVWVLDEGEARPVEVRTGITDGAFTEIADGRLSEGASVILESL